MNRVSRPFYKIDNLVETNLPLQAFTRQTRIAAKIDDTKNPRPPQRREIGVERAIDEDVAIEIGIYQALSLGTYRVVPIGSTVANSTVCPVDIELCSCSLSNFCGGFDHLVLRRKRSRCS